MSPSPVDARLLRWWLHRLPNRLSEREIAAIVDLYVERADDLPPNRFVRFGLLARSIVDAARHGASARDAPVTHGSALRYFDSVIQDVRFAWRSYRSRPGFALIAIGALGLGVGGTTAMFSVVDGVLIRDLPYDEPETLVSIWKKWPSWVGDEDLDYVADHIQFPWADYVNVRDRATTLRAVAAYSQDRFVMTGLGDAIDLSVGEASANLFAMLGVQPILGRTFRDDEVAEAADRARLIVLSHELWTTRFAGRRDVLGETVRLGGHPYEIIGVLPRGFRLVSDLVTIHDNGGTVDTGLRDLWVPFRTHYERRGNAFELIGRVADGQTAASVRDEVQTLMTEGPADQLARVVSRKEVVTQGFQAPLLLLLAAAAILTLIACTNVMGLLVGDAAIRHREIAMRAALGARRARVVRQLLTESALLGVLGATLGIVLAWAGTALLLTVAPPLPRLEELGMHGRVFLFAMTTGVGTSILFGIVPALVLSHSTNAIRTRSDSRGLPRLQSAVVGVQLALTVILMVMGALFGSSLLRVMSVHPGFDTANLATMTVTLPPGTDAAPEAISREFDRVLAAAARVPGILALSAATALPFPTNCCSSSVDFDRGGESVERTPWVRRARPNFAETMGIPLLQGRWLSAADPVTPPVPTLVSAAFAQEAWPGRSPIGRHISWHVDNDLIVVGVVGNVRHTTLRGDAEMTIYVPDGYSPMRTMSLVVRTPGPEVDVVPPLREAVAAVNGGVAVGEAAMVADLVRASESDARFRAILIWTFAIIATVLASVGVFGVTAQAVASRKREIGIRSALGAQARGLVALVLRDGLRSVALGITGGLMVAGWLTGLVGHLLYGVTARDPFIYVTVGAAAVLVFLIAAYLPARRATLVDPAMVMTQE